MERGEQVKHPEGLESSLCLGTVDSRLINELSRTIGAWKRAEKGGAINQHAQLACY